MMRIGPHGERVRMIAGWIAIAIMPYVLEQFLIPRAPFEPVGFFQRPRGTTCGSRHAAIRIVDETPRREAIFVLMRVEDTIPVDQYIEALRKYIGIKTAVAGSGLV